MRIMYDSVNPRKLPLDAKVIAGYINGRYRWADRAWSWFPHSTHVSISVDPNLNSGIVLDVEPGCARNDQVVAWVRKRRLQNVDPTIYTSLSNWANIEHEFEKAGERRPHYWIAKWDNDPKILAGSIAHQYETKGPYDLSVVADYWPGVDKTRKSANDKLSYYRYRVEPGDNLIKIGHKFNVSVDRIVRTNDINNPNIIYAGQVIKIPRR